MSSRAATARRARSRGRRAAPPPRTNAAPRAPRAPAPADRRLELQVRSIAGEPSTEALFERLFGDGRARVLARQRRGADAARAVLLSRHERRSGALRAGVRRRGENRQRRTATGRRTVEHGSIFDVLDRELAGRRDRAAGGAGAGPVGGFVGYIGYECKADCGSPNVHRSEVPDAVLMLANRIVAVDHVRHRTHLLALGSAGATRDAARWLDDAEAAVRRAARRRAAARPAATPAAAAEGAGGRAGALRLRARTRAVSRGHRALPGGACSRRVLRGLPHRPVLDHRQPEPFALYRLLRASNPAPFAAYLKFGELAVLSSSPERFLSVDRDRRVEARPIKGTAPRSSDPARDQAAAARSCSTTRRHSPST